MSKNRIYGVHGAYYERNLEVEAEKNKEEITRLIDKLNQLNSEYSNNKNPLLLQEIQEQEGLLEVARNRVK